MVFTDIVVLYNIIRNWIEFPEFVADAHFRSPAPRRTRHMRLFGTLYHSAYCEQGNVVRNQCH